MANQDYLLRMIEQFMVFISRVVFKRNAGLYEEAQVELDGIVKDLGRFDKAEDFLFELIPSSDEGAIGLGKDFYSRLRELSDENLEKGGLPRVEVEEGFEYLLGLEGRADLPP